MGPACTPPGEGALPGAELHLGASSPSRERGKRPPPPTAESQPALLVWSPRSPGGPREPSGPRPRPRCYGRGLLRAPPGQGPALLRDSPPGPAAPHVCPASGRKTNRVITTTTVQALSGCSSPLRAPLCVHSLPATGLGGWVLPLPPPVLALMVRVSTTHRVA